MAVPKGTHSVSMTEKERARQTEPTAPGRYRVLMGMFAMERSTVCVIAVLKIAKTERKQGL